MRTGSAAPSGSIADPVSCSIGPRRSRISSAEPASPGSTRDSSLAGPQMPARAQVAACTLLAFTASAALPPVRHGEHLQGARARLWRRTFAAYLCYRSALVAMVLSGWRCKLKLHLQALRTSRSCQGSLVESL
eukprot:6133632-Pleurochrysis_carterae.AAC.1